MPKKRYTHIKAWSHFDKEVKATPMSIFRESEQYRNQIQARYEMVRAEKLSQLDV